MAPCRRGLPAPGGRDARRVLGGCGVAGFVFDDEDLILGNPNLADGLTGEGVRWAFTSFHRANWHPLTWLSHQAVVGAFGMAPGPHHAVNLAIHAAAALALFLVLRGATGSLWRSAAVAALFAVHPLRAESVAWVSERKDVLSALWWFLAIGAYVRYARRPSLARYLSVGAALALGLLSKAMGVTLPVVLLLLDVWPLGRLGRGQPARLQPQPRAVAASAGSSWRSCRSRRSARPSAWPPSLPSAPGGRSWRWSSSPRRAARERAAFRRHLPRPDGLAAGPRRLLPAPAGAPGGREGGRGLPAARGDDGRAPAAVAARTVPRCRLAVVPRRAPAGERHRPGGRPGARRPLHVPAARRPGDRVRLGRRGAHPPGAAPRAAPRAGGVSRSARWRCSAAFRSAPGGTTSRSTGARWPSRGTTG